jgi:V8-like Glu-specific endopeptidase
MSPRNATLSTGLALCIALACLSAPSSAQEAPPPSRMTPYPADTGVVENSGASRAVIASFQVQVQGAEWIRLHFAEVQLSGSIENDTASIVRITSYVDGGTQELNAEHVAQWEKTSAYFNGDSVQVEVLAYPKTGQNRVVLSKVELGIPVVAQKTQCGTTDDRVQSFDKRSCRAMPVGCTAWLINDCGHCMLTAGHCCCSSLQVMEFNVPNSTAGGSVVHPPPQDQYAVDPVSRQSQYITIGQDFTYFGVFANSTTGLSPFEAQNGGVYTLANPPAFNPSITIRITGYGVDSTPATMNQVQQTSTGPYSSFSGTTVQYRCDTEGGNSGSAVQWEQGGVAIGIHTNGGCTSSGGANSGTGINYGPLQTALASPKGVCLITPSATTYCTAKVTSNGCTPSISTTGTPTISGGAGSFSINATNAINQKSGLLFYGFKKQAAPLFGGTLCVGGTLVRTAVQNSGGSASGTDCSGTFTFDMGGWISSGADPALFSAKHVEAQYWFRDAGFAPPDNVGFTNAVEFVIGC